VTSAPLLAMSESLVLLVERSRFTACVQLVLRAPRLQPCPRSNCRARLGPIEDCPRSPTESSGLGSGDCYVARAHGGTCSWIARR
jgi:hypothetical protein